MCVCVCVQNFKSEKKLQVPASIRKLLTFISSMLYTLHNTWGDVLLVVLVNLRKNKKKRFRKVDFPGFPWATVFINADQKWWRSDDFQAWTLITIYSHVQDPSLITLLSRQPTSKKTPQTVFGVLTQAFTGFIYSKKNEDFFFFTVMFSSNETSFTKVNSNPLKDSPLMTVEKLLLTFWRSMI